MSRHGTQPRQVSNHAQQATGIYWTKQSTGRFLPCAPATRTSKHARPAWMIY
ncbi:hypothetical protein KPSA1_03546 [Pseudomonas syringae pv. actinidiae]|uniref:Uncharacterized protein n=1 Tax=Pseudomonas syringae pv. actinidiae TaxID=103796 RepID=A0A2V0QAU5_PSESF|nr:hypothetical protein KPSA1_03546 [Pseudomonas syringae pv. actinidiae]